MNTLRGIFPEPKQIPKRNFVKENMVQIKQMQGLVPSSDSRYPGTRKEKTCIIRPNQTLKKQNMVRSAENTRQQTKGTSKLEKPKMLTNEKSNKFNKLENTCCRTAVETMNVALTEKKKSKEIGIQTENYANAKQLYETGTIKYAKPYDIIGVQTRQKSPSKDKHSLNQTSPNIGDGDSARKSPNMEELTIGKKHDYVKENAQVVQSSQTKTDKSNNPTNAPSSYKKGVVPKYIRDRKEQLHKQAKSSEGDDKCPDGHVILPENERKETLRMLRQSYAELITELNMMPVRSDTLKIRNRKIELESQLKKLDEGIKVFTRPKVFVKIGA